MDDDYDEIFNSPSLGESFKHATVIATLAEKFNLTLLKPFQRTIIDAVLDSKLKTHLLYSPREVGKVCAFNIHQFI